MIVVTGANGQLGRLVVEKLLDRVPAQEIGVSVREPERARAFAERGVRVRRGDFTDAASLLHAFEDATKVLVVSADAVGDTAVKGHRTAIEAAAAAGAKRVLYTSHMGADPSSPFPPMPDHAATERDLQRSGIPFTSLRNGFYATSAAMLLGAAVETGELRAPEDGPVAWTAHTDLAEAAALALVGETDELDGFTPALTAAESVDMAGIAEIASRISGRTIRRVVVSDADYRAGLLGHGVPEPAADLLVGLFAASRRGAFAPADPALARLLGRPTVPVEDVLRSAVTA
ncbi:NAD(P)H-binding protein [Streptomyces sp. NPDC057094]|uniref:NAD(P)H-binding protein n=1 Tax=Streptomyces sp. NPDC057094 TaxID=3346018 RepID=UPI003626A7CD